MLRIGFVSLVWVSFLGGVGWYQHHRQTVLARDVTVSLLDDTVTDQLVSIKITPGFTPEADFFALRTQSDSQSDTLTVMFNGVQVWSRADFFPAHQPMQLDHVSGVLSGLNEIHVYALTPHTAMGQSYALRVQVYHHQRVLAEQSFWSDDGSPIAGTMRFNFKGMSASEHHVP